MLPGNVQSRKYSVSASRIHMVPLDTLVFPVGLLFFLLFDVLPVILKSGVGYLKIFLYRV